MGTYLSTPVLDKHSEDGSDLSDVETPVRWAVVDMQGWRKSMEDAHVARTDVSLPWNYIKSKEGGSKEGDEEENGSSPTHAKVFAVFDGHGGAEVARFCQIHLVPVLTSQGQWEGSSETTEETPPTTTEETTTSSSSGQVATGEEGKSTEKLLASNIGQSLISTFHDLDILINDPKSRIEIDKWRTERPPTYVHGQDNPMYNVQDGDGVVESTDDEDEDVEEEYGCRVTLLENNYNDDFGEDEEDDDDEEDEVPIAERQTRRHTVMDPNEIAEDAAKLHLIDDGMDDKESDDDDDDEEEDTSLKIAETISDEKVVGEEEEEVAEQKKATMMNGTGNERLREAKGETKDASNLLDAVEDDDDVFVDSLSEEPTPLSDDLLENKEAEGVVHDDSDDEKVEQTNENENDDGEVSGVEEKKESGTFVSSANDAVALFQKLLHMNGTDAGEDEDSDDEEDDTYGKEDKIKINGEGENDDGNNSGEGGGEEHQAEDNGIVIPTRAQLLNPPTGIVAPSASVPTRIQNGRKICNLPDHPVHAGCTSVVAVIVGRTLVVANAGDSRAVVCRAGGLTEPLSFDHKPLQNREMNRITNAGGFVNQFGRVNGNLNLSRSIGDLKYKQVPGIPPSEQMITAEPDILSTTLRTGDEFIVLGCDGIWDCLSNEECVKYVRDRIESKHPLEIGKEMLDEIVSADPRASQGIGGDNMTIMIIDLLPQSRSYSNSSDADVAR